MVMRNSQICYKSLSKFCVFRITLVFYVKIILMHFFCISMDFFEFYMYIFVIILRLWSNIMLNSTSMLKIVYSAKGHMTLDRNWTGSSLKETFSRLYYIISGEAEIWHHEEKFLLVPGRLYLIPPNSNMRYRCRESVTIGWVHFNIFIYGHLDIFEDRIVSFVYIPENKQEAEQYMLEMLDLFERQDMFSQLRSQSLLFKQVCNFFKFNAERELLSKTEKDIRLTAVLEYIDIHLGESLKLADLAKIAAYEQTYFSSMFKQHFSVSPIKYIQNKRIEKARSLLRYGNQKLSAIADELGFSDVFHFSKTFKKITGESPTVFRKRIPTQIP